MVEKDDIRKTRILWVGEYSYSVTGFAVISKAILNYLFSTDKYEIAELASYIDPRDPRIMEAPWKVYTAQPNPDDAYGIHRFNSSNLGQFGEAMFEQACLDFRPDIVIDIRDHWMCSWQLRSPFRKNYKIIWMPTIDGEPQKVDWLEDYLQIDCLLTYSQYGKDILDKQTNGKIKVFDVAKPAVDPSIFKPLDKKKLREKYKISQNTKLMMMFSRNQKRKLYPDLFDAFKQYISICVDKGNEDLANNTYLLCHTSFPDVGWALNDYLLRHKIGHKVLFTYKCRNCKTCYPDFFQTERSFCRECGQYSLFFTSTQDGVTSSQLAELYNLGDLYVQYTICEGQSNTTAEAKACGIPSCGTDYTAIANQVNAPGCFPLPVQRFFSESIQETSQDRALPDNDEAARKFYNFFCLPEDTRKAMGESARKDAVENYSFDRAAKIFEKAIDSMSIYNQEETWLNPSLNLINIPTTMPNSIKSHDELVKWAINDIFEEPNLIGTSFYFDLLSSLNTGTSKSGRRPFNESDCLNLVASKANNKNTWEKARHEKFFGKSKKKRFELV